MTLSVIQDLQCKLIVL